MNWICLAGLGAYAGYRAVDLWWQVILIMKYTNKKTWPHLRSTLFSSIFWALLNTWATAILFSEAFE